jgi:actin-related protein 3
VIPCAEGYVIGSAIKHIPIAGRDISQFVLNLLRERGELAAVPSEDHLRVASKVKEDYSYVCQDIVKEFRKYDAEPYKYFERYDGEHSVTGKASPFDHTTAPSIDSPCRNIQLTSDMSVSLPPKSSSTQKFTPLIS